MPSAQIEEVVLKEVNEGTSNSYRVPRKQWDRWSEHARSTFNRTYSAMSHNQEFFIHPKQKKVSDELWKTPCWNAAWTAADAVDAYVAKE